MNQELDSRPQCQNKRLSIQTAETSNNSHLMNASLNQSYQSTLEFLAIMNDLSYDIEPNTPEIKRINLLMEKLQNVNSECNMLAYQVQVYKRLLPEIQLLMNQKTQSFQKIFQSKTQQFKEKLDGFQKYVQISTQKIMKLQSKQAEDLKKIEEYSQNEKINEQMIEKITLQCQIEKKKHQQTIQKMNQQRSKSEFNHEQTITKLKQLCVLEQTKHQQSLKKISQCIVKELIINHKESDKLLIQTFKNIKHQLSDREPSTDSGKIILCLKMFKPLIQNFNLLLKAMDGCQLIKSKLKLSEQSKFKQYKEAIVNLKQFNFDPVRDIQTNFQTNLVKIAKFAGQQKPKFIDIYNKSGELLTMLQQKYEKIPQQQINTYELHSPLKNKTQIQNNYKLLKEENNRLVIQKQNIQKQKKELQIKINKANGITESIRQFILNEKNDLEIPLNKQLNAQITKDIVHEIHQIKSDIADIFTVMKKRYMKNIQEQKTQSLINLQFSGDSESNKSNMPLQQSYFKLNDSKVDILIQKQEIKEDVESQAKLLKQQLKNKIQQNQQLKREIKQNLMNLKKYQSKMQANQQQLKKQIIILKNQINKKQQLKIEDQNLLIQCQSISYLPDKSQEKVKLLTERIKIIAGNIKLNYQSLTKAKEKLIEAHNRLIDQRTRADDCLGWAAYIQTQLNRQDLIKNISQSNKRTINLILEKTRYLLDNVVKINVVLNSQDEDFKESIKKMQNVIKQMANIFYKENELNNESMESINMSILNEMEHRI